MSGLVALFRRDRGRVDRDVFRTMLDRIDHRGPDGRGSWCDDRVGLGHQQLHATPESEYDEQPYREDGFVISADARLDNRAELFDRLDIRDPPRRVPDSQLLLSAYREWGTQCASRLVGAFAFVVWDPEREIVFCARDHMGVKPIYYHESPDVFALSSELKSLLELPSVSRTLDEERVGDFFVRRFTSNENTVFESVRRLPPAQTMTVGPSETTTNKYWSPEPKPLPSLHSDADYERRFRELFTQAVQCRLRASGAVGTELSGGLDSSTVTVVARDLLPDGEPLHTFSNVFETIPESDEREYIEAVAAHDGIRPHYVQTDDVGSLVDRERLLSHHDRPIHNPAHFTGWERAKTARNADVDVLLTGVAGDAAIGYGLHIFLELLRTGRWGQLHHELDSASNKWGTSRRTLFVEYCLKPLFPDSLLRRYQQLKGAPILEARRNATLDPAFVKRSDLRRRYKRHHTTGWDLLQNSRQRHCRSVTDVTFTEAFEFVDLRDAAFGIEPRHPFTDKRLLEFLVSIPVTQRFSDGWQRSIVRWSFDDLLPKKVRCRLWKTYMDDAVGNALRAEGKQLHEMVTAPGTLPNFLDMEELRSMYDMFVDDASSKHAKDLWPALAFWSWSREWQDSDGD